jgi:L-threonylcarbamoyladenylate synthase
MLPLMLTGDTDTIGVRHSSHPVANMLVAAFGGPITATSANIAGQKPAVSAPEIERYFRKGVDAILNGGKTPGGKGSTIIGLGENRLRLIRDGVVPLTRIIEAVSASADR